MANMIKVKVNQLKDRLALDGLTMAMANTKGILQSLFCPMSRPDLRAREKIISHFRIPSSGHLRPRLNRKILEIVRLFLWFCSIGSAKFNLNLGAISENLFLREPLLPLSYPFSHRIMKSITASHNELFPWARPSITERWCFPSCTSISPRSPLARHAWRKSVDCR